MLQHILFLLEKLIQLTNMKKYNEIVCIPKNDNTKRFLIGKKGQHEMLAIALNPSTANEDKLDPTSKNIELIANNNGCDGWWLVNLYPERISNPNKLTHKGNIKLTKKNIEFIKRILISPNYNFSKIICCWGNFITKRSFLSESANQLLIYLKSQGYASECLGYTQQGNPYHPSPLTINRLFGGINNINLVKFI